MQAALTQFEHQSYLNLETYRRTGEAMPTPVWFVRDGDTLFVRTIADSGKVKRLRANARVRVMPCGQRGEPLGSWVPAQARETGDPATQARVRELLLAKYGEMVRTFEARTLASGQRYTVISIDIIKE